MIMTKPRIWAKITEDDGSISYEDWGNCPETITHGPGGPDCDYELIDYPPPSELLKIITEKRKDIENKRLEIADLEQDINYYLTLIN